MSNYVKSRSKTGKLPRTGNTYKGSYTYVQMPDAGKQERIFVLAGKLIRKGVQVKDFKAFNSEQAAAKAGWTKVPW